MLSLLLRRKRNDVRTILTGYMSRHQVKQVRQESRRSARGAYCEVAWLIPYNDDEQEPIYDRAFPLVTKDICQDGLALIHNAPVTDRRVMIGLPGDVSVCFFSCRVEHCTPLGYGFYQLGTQVYNLVEVSPCDVHAFERRRRQFETEPAVALI